MNAGPARRNNPQVISQLLLDWREGDTEAREKLLILMYEEMRRLAQHYLRQERPGHTLQATALVHELYLRLIASEPVSWQNRAHFFAAAAQQMRRLLVDHARKRASEKGGGGLVKVTLSNIAEWKGAPDQDVLALDEALEQLAVLDARAAQVVEARFFGGLKEDEACEALGISLATLKRDWKFARAWLFDRLAAR